MGSVVCSIVHGELPITCLNIGKNNDDTTCNPTLIVLWLVLWLVYLFNDKSTIVYISASIIYNEFSMNVHAFLPPKGPVVLSATGPIFY